MCVSVLTYNNKYSTLYYHKKLIFNNQKLTQTIQFCHLNFK